MAPFPWPTKNKPSATPKAKSARRTSLKRWVGAHVGALRSRLSIVRQAEATCRAPVENHENMIDDSGDDEEGEGKKNISSMAEPQHKDTQSLRNERAYSTESMPGQDPQVSSPSPPVATGEVTTDEHEATSNENISPEPTNQAPLQDASDNLSLFDRKSRKSVRLVPADRNFTSEPVPLSSHLAASALPAHWLSSQSPRALEESPAAPALRGYTPLKLSLV